MQMAFKYIEFRDYYNFGAMIGYIVSDLLYINPVSYPVWSDDNSHVILSDTSSLKVPSSFYQPIVQSNKPKELFQKLIDFSNTFIKSDDKETKNNLNYVRR